MGLLPEGLTYTSPTTLSDTFGHEVTFFHDGRPRENHFNFAINYKNSKESSMTCKTLVEMALHWRQKIWLLYRQPWSKDSGIPYYMVHGDKYCTSYTSCLHNLTMTDIEEICYFYRNKDESKYRYRIQIVFKAD